MKIGYFIANSLHYLPTVLPLIQKTKGKLISFKKIPGSYLPKTYDFEINYFRNYKDLLKKFKDLDIEILVHPSFSVQYFKNLPKIKHVQIFHGTSDKPFNFHKSLKYYDLIVVPGMKMKEDIIKKGLANEEKIKIIGYPKIDEFMNSDFDSNLFSRRIGIDDKKKIILYSPTWVDPDRYSSFPKFIKVILKNLTNYNVIIKPHPNIFKYRPWQILKAYLIKKKNAFIYPGNLSILPLMKISDILLTDISSVSHEYLPFMKPMIFLAPKPLNEIPHEHRWIWRCGDIVENPSLLPIVVEKNINEPTRYLNQRSTALKKIFYNFDGRSAYRFKQIIENMLFGN